MLEPTLLRWLSVNAPTLAALAASCLKQLYFLPFLTDVQQESRRLARRQHAAAAMSYRCPFIHPVVSLTALVVMRCHTSVPYSISGASPTHQAYGGVQSSSRPTYPSSMRIAC